MDKLISILAQLPEYEQMLQGVADGENIAVSGIGQINRSHLISGLCKDIKRPIVIVCQDDLTAKRIQEELKSFLSVDVPSLPSRELTLYDTAVVSRAWEQKRLRQLYDLSLSKTPVQIMTWESLSQRTIAPPTKTLPSSAYSIGLPLSPAAIVVSRPLWLSIALSPV